MNVLKIWIKMVDTGHFLWISQTLTDRESNCGENVGIPWFYNGDD